MNECPTCGAAVFLQLALSGDEIPLDVAYQRRFVLREHKGVLYAVERDTFTKHTCPPAEPKECAR